jgi:hypothetical protein
MIVKVVEVDSESLIFDNGVRLYSNHDTDCCESHWLCFNDLSLEDFEGLEFDLSNDSFFERVNGYGIALKPIFGHPVRVPGYGSNNGYYSDQLELIVSNGNDFTNTFDISECQDISVGYYRDNIKL